LEDVSLDVNPGVHLKSIPPKLTRWLTVLALLCLLGEMPMRLYGHLRWIETMQVDATESDLLAFLELAFGQIPVLPVPHGSSQFFLKLSTSIRFASLPLIIGLPSIPLVGRSLGGCGS
jgi:hypothetical protein